MRRLGQLAPKATLVAYDRPLLIRLLDQAHEAGFTRVIISTSPAHYSRFGQLVATASDQSQCDGGRTPSQVRVLENHAHARGPLEALQEALTHVETADCLMCLGDMFFRGNPFIPFNAVRGATADWVGVAQPVDERELTHGGLAVCRDAAIVDVRERPGVPPFGAVRWSGIARFDRELAHDLQAFLDRAPPGSPEGDLFAYRIERGRPARAVQGPDFVNINSPPHLLLATLYAAADAQDIPPEAAASLDQTALRVRRALLDQSPRRVGALRNSRRVSGTR